MDQDPAARRLDHHRLVRRLGQPLGIGRQRLSQRLDPEDLRRLRRPEPLAIEGRLDDADDR